MNPTCFAAGDQDWARGLCNRCYAAAKKSGEIDKYPREVRVCGRCDAVFEIKSSKARYCSSACQLATTAIRRKRVTKENIVKKSGRKCMVCDEVIPSEYRADAKFCSKGCQQSEWYRQNEPRLKEESKQWALDNRDRVAEHHQRRRFRKMNAPYETTIDIYAVYERDNYTCWICEDPVDMALKAPHPMCKNMDHVIPLARGGAHALNNLALAHAICNNRKRARILDKVPRWWVDANADRMATQP